MPLDPVSLAAPTAAVCAEPRLVGNPAQSSNGCGVPRPVALGPHSLLVRGPKGWARVTLHGAQEPTSDHPASTSSVDHPSVVLDQLVCADQDSLAAAFVAGVVLGASPAQIAKYGCQTIPKDAQVEILERFPSSFQFVRVVKVNVTSPPQSNSTVGYTFEITR
jgi:hypothetical protein